MTTVTAPYQPDSAVVLHAISDRSFATLATVSPAGHPHAAGVLYAFTGGALVISTRASSRKARNIAANGKVGVVIPVRRIPIGGPPSSIQFQSTARLASADDDEIQAWHHAKRIKAVTSHGELDLLGGCFIVVPVPERVLTYGIGMSLLQLIRDPLGAGGEVLLR